MQAPNNPYKPNNNALFCKDPLCAFIDPPTNYPCKAPNDQCDYEVHYADYGSSLGVLVRDSFPLRFTNGSVYRPTMAFGCVIRLNLSSSPTNFQFVNKVFMRLLSPLVQFIISILRLLFLNTFFFHR